MNDYDQAARFAVKSDPAGFLRWMVPGLPPSLEFRGWLDARTLPFPGEPDRTCDTVAELFDPAEPNVRWALATEFQAEPDPDMLDRLLEYLARLRRELRHGPRRRGKFRVVAALVHLTGPPCVETLDMALPGESAVGLRLRIASRAFQAEGAAPTLADIAAGRATRWLLPWIPLMKGGGKPTMMEEWIRIAGAEPNPRWRANYASLALVFVELTRYADLWKKSLEGWNMRKSPIVTEWRNEGRAEGRAEAALEIRRADILRLLNLKFPGQVPADLVAAVEAQEDLDELSRWLDAVFTSPSLAECRAALKTGGAG